MVYPDRSIGDFDMTSMADIDSLAQLWYNTIGPHIYSKAARRAWHLELFINNNLDGSIGPLKGSMSSSKFRQRSKNGRMRTWSITSYL